MSSTNTYLEIVTKGGSCPYQAEGWVDGFPFYFRSRGSRWGFHVGQKGDPLDYCEWGVTQFVHEEDYGAYPDAGHITHEIAELFIRKAAEIFHNQLKHETQS